ncbi:MAG: peptidylprolyl isomerase [Blastocatellia bacterium]
MKIRSGLWLLVLLVLAFGSTSCGNGVGDRDEVAVLETNYGNIVIEFMPDVAPKHVANFKKLARENFYAGTKFHKIIKITGKLIGIQGGDPNTINGDPATWGNGQQGQPRVPGEFSKTLRHDRGIISAVRNPNDPDSATSQFIICTAPNPGWDGQYTIFAKVIEGMNVVDVISKAPALGGGDRPLDPVVIKSVRLVKRDEVK